ncbi:MAG: hypothetical protein WBQ20_15105, partial [Methyloceanibacter sp.]
HNQRELRLVFLRRPAVAVLLRRTVLAGFLAARFLRAGLSRLRRAVFSAARLIAGLDRVSFARPAASAALVFSSTTSVAAFAAAPIASPAAALTVAAPRLAARTIVCLVLVTGRTLVFRLPVLRIMGRAKRSSIGSAPRVTTDARSR